MEERSELREPGRDILRLKIADSQPVAGRECRTSTPPDADRYVTYTFLVRTAAAPYSTSYRATYPPAAALTTAPATRHSGSETPPQEEMARRASAVRLAPATMM